MCGRFVSSTPPDQLATYFEAVPAFEQLLDPSYNVAPTNDVYAVVEQAHSEGPRRELTRLHWGLVPPWAKDPSVGSRMINARAETLAERNAYRNAFRRRRCLVPLDGFYEWRKVPGHKRKQPYFIHRIDGEPLAVAGLWERWVDKAAVEPTELRSCTIVTGPPNGVVAPIHDRMPVILAPEVWELWLDPSVGERDVLEPLLVAAPDELLAVRAVGTAVNQVRNKGAELIEPLAPGEELSPLPSMGDDPGS